MRAKYRPHYNDIIEYLYKRVVANAGQNQVAMEVQEKFRPEIFFPKMDPEMVYETICMMYELAFFIVNKKPYKE